MLDSIVDTGTAVNPEKRTLSDIVMGTYSNEITLKDVMEKLIRLEVMVSELLTRVGDHDIIRSEVDASPFLNPETGLYSAVYYRENNP
jgi:hypothetical protein